MRSRFTHEATDRNPVSRNIQSFRPRALTLSGIATGVTKPERHSSGLRQRTRYAPAGTASAPVWSQSAVEPLSVRAAGFPPGKGSAKPETKRTHISRDRDWLLSRFPRQSPGKLKTIPQALGNRISTGLRGGAGRTQTGNQPIMGPKLIVSGGGRTIGRQDRRPIDMAPPAQAPSRWHHAVESRQ
jgi:hypothetical protein